ncbi:MAG TPA: hypothetical protein VF782_06680 [Allosphingosinicella sp.]|jgi:hypothetical protein
MRITLGQWLVGMAAVEVIVVWAMVRRLPEDASAERVRVGRIVLGAAIASGIGLCLVGLLVPSLSEIILF